MASSTVSECHDGSDVDGVNSRQHVLSGNRPPTVTANPPIFDVPNNKSVTDEHFGKRPPELQAVPLMPKTTVNDDNGTVSNTVRNVKLTELTGMVTVSNSLHAQKLRQNEAADLVGPGEYVETQGFPARGYPCESVRRGALSAEQPRPNQKGRLAVRSLGVASPRGADAGPRGEVSGESFG
jgi:hypothetical protein